MARTCGSMDNSRGNQVTAQSATYSHLRGWDVGVRVRFAPDGDTDRFQVWMTYGSNGDAPDILLGVVKATPDGPKWVPDKNHD